MSSKAPTPESVRTAALAAAAARVSSPVAAAQLPPREDLPHFRAPGALPPFLWIVAAIATCIRLAWINVEGLWLDEIYVYNDCLRPAWRILDTVHPLHFFVGKLFLALNDSAWMVRLPCVLWAALTFPALFGAVRELWGAHAARASVLFLAASSFHFNFALDANYYAPVMFWCAVSLWAFGRHLRNGHPLDAVLAIGCAVLAMGFHPFAGVFTGPLVATILLRILTNRVARRAMFPWLWFREGRVRSGALLAVVELSIPILLVWKVLPRARGLARTLVEKLSAGATFQNIKLEPLFFIEYFGRKLATYSFESPVLSALVLYGFVLLLVGVVAALRRRPLFAIFALLSVVGSFVLIFNLKADRFFHQRYLSSHFVIFCALAGIAVDALSGGVRSSAVKRGARLLAAAAAVACVVGTAVAVALHWTRLPLFLLDPIALAACAIPFAVLALPLDRWRSASAARPASWRQSRFLFVLAITPILLPNLVSISRRLVAARPNWRSIEAVWREEHHTGQPVIFQHDPEMTVARFYMKQAGISDSDALGLVTDYNNVDVRMEQLRTYARTFDDGWLVRCWENDTTPTLRQWAEEYFDPVLEAPSSFGTVMNAKLFRMQGSRGRYLTWPYGMTIEWTKEEAALATPKRELRVDRGGEFAVRAKSSSGGVSPLAIPPRISIDGTPLAAPPLPGGWQRVALQTGRHTISCDDASHDIEISALALPEGAEFDAADLTVPWPSHLRISTVGGQRLLRLITCVTIGYEFHFPEPGVWLLEVEGFADPATPPYLGVLLDNDSFLGILPFDQHPGEWLRLQMPLRIDAAGRHSVHLTYLNGLLANSGREGESHALLRKLKLRRLGVGEVPPDNRLRFTDRMAPEPSTFASSVIDAEGIPDANWTLFSLPQDGVELRRSAQPIGFNGTRGVEIVTPPLAEGFNYIGPARENPGRPGVVLATAEVDTQALVNHSVALGILWLDEQGRALQGSPAIKHAGLMRTFRGMTMTVLAPVPAQARSYAPIFSIYRNGHAPATDPGYIRIGSVRIAEFPWRE